MGAILFIVVMLKPGLAELVNLHTFGVITAIVFGQAIQAARGHWQKRRLWFLLGAFLAAQCVLGIAVLGLIQKVPVVYWVLFYPIDYGLLTAYLRRLLPSASP